MGHRVARLKTLQLSAYAKDEYAKFGAKNFGEASRQAALDMIADINGALGK